MSQVIKTKRCVTLKNRLHSGFSLIVVVGLGTIIALWMMAAMAALLPTYQRAAQGRYLTVTRSSAEAGLDYVVSDLARVVGTGSPSIYDATQPNTTKTSTIPASVIGNTGATVTVTVKNMQPPIDSSVYDPQKDPGVGSSGVLTNGWRMVTATATYAGIPKSIRVVLEPEYNAPTPGAGTPYFVHALFGKTLVAMDSNLSTNGYDSTVGAYGGSNVDAIGGDIGSNGQITLGGNTATIGGTLYVTSDPSKPTVLVAQDTGNPNPYVINANVKVNGTTSGFVANTNPTGTPNGNVIGMGNTPRTGQILTAQGMPQVVVPAAPAAPSTAVNLGSVSLGSGQHLDLQPGDYIATSINITSSGILNLVPNGGGSYGAVNIYLQGSTPGTTALSVKGTGGLNNQSHIPSNFRIWYGGSKDISLLSDKYIYGVIYAPNAKINVMPNQNSGSDIFGAIVGNNVMVQANQGIYVHFDKALKSGGSRQISYGASPTATQTGIRTISWQEL